MAFLGAVRTVLVDEGSGMKRETFGSVSVGKVPGSVVHEEEALADVLADGVPFVTGVVTIFFYIGGVSKEYRPFYLKVITPQSCLDPCLP